MRRTMIVLGALALTAPLLAGGCTVTPLVVGQDDAGSGGSDSGGASDGGPFDGGSGPCTNDNECGPGQACAYPVADGCSAKGQCVAIGGTCGIADPACACDGTDTHIGCAGVPGLPNGYAAKPVAHAGVCEGGGPSACTNAGGVCVFVFSPNDGGWLCPPGYSDSNLSCGPGGGDCCQCFPLPCPSGAQWNPATCSCGGAADGGAFDATSFACGDKTCGAGQYCVDHQSGIPSDGSIDSYECDPVPAQCAGAPTCACIVPLLTACPLPACSDGNGQVSVTCAGI